MAAGDSATSICNIGLIAIGEEPIASLGDNRKAAILCATRYDQIRRKVLRMHPWNFARKQAQLAAGTAGPLFTYANAYPLPPDFIRMDDLPDNDQAAWDVIGNQLMTDEGAPLNVLYVSDVQDPTRFDPLFVEALGYSIAAELAQPMRQSQSLEQEMLTKVKDNLAIAQLIGSQENSSAEWDVDVWLRHRR